MQVAQRAHGTALIAEGLRAGETVVAQGQSLLVAGTLVRSARPSEVADNTAANAGLLP